MMAKIHEFEVDMTCEGCSGAVERVLQKLKGAGVDDVKIDLPAKKVFVTSTLSPEAVLEVIKKTGKASSYKGSKDA